MPIDTGACPRCNDAIQPKDPKGLRSRPVDGVLFCVFCAEVCEQRPAVKEKYVSLAKMEAGA